MFIFKFKQDHQINETSKLTYKVNKICKVNKNVSTFILMPHGDIKFT